MEEVSVQGVLLLLVLTLLGAVGQGVLWLYRMRRTAAIPFLLLPPENEILRALLLGIALPMLVYWLYTRLPIIGGREFGWSSSMRPRFIIELSVLGFLMLWLPGRFIRRYLHRRFDELGIALPSHREERLISWKVRGAIVATLLLTAVALLSPAHNSYPYELTVELLLAVGIAFAAIRYAMRSRHQHGLYYGTLARSLAPVYAFSILFLTLVVQSWLCYNEAIWLRKDIACLGYLANCRETTTGITSIEAEAAQRVKGMVLMAMTERE